MKVPNGRSGLDASRLSLSRLQNEGSQRDVLANALCTKSIKATE